MSEKKRSTKKASEKLYWWWYKQGMLSMAETGPTWQGRQGRKRGRFARPGHPYWWLKPPGPCTVA